MLPHPKLLRYLCGRKNYLFVFIMVYEATETVTNGSNEMAWIIWALIGGFILLSFGLSAYEKVRRYNKHHRFISWEKNPKILDEWYASHLNNEEEDEEDEENNDDFYVYF